VSFGVWEEKRQWTEGVFCRHSTGASDNRDLRKNPGASRPEKPICGRRDHKRNANNEQNRGASWLFPFGSNRLRCAFARRTFPAFVLAIPTAPFAMSATRGNGFSVPGVVAIWPLTSTSKKRFYDFLN